MMQIRPWIISGKHLVRKGYLGFAFWPFIVLKNKAKTSDKTLRHEGIHLHQQREMLVLPFYLWYFLEYGFRRLQYPSWSEAYRNISFEREAFANENDEGYLKKRRFWSWVGYLGK